jgi:sarcosine oxidase subunit beta
MPVETTDVLIVGAGIAGTTLALELARMGTKVTLVDRRYVGGGSSSLNAGGIRQQFSQEINVRVAANTVRRISAVREEFGEDVAYRQTGYLFLYATAEQERLLTEAIALQNRWDVPTRLVTQGEISDLLPGAGLEGVLGGSFGPSDGYVDPRAVVTAFGRAAAGAGVRIKTAEITGFETSDNRATAVLAGDRRFEADVVVNAAGAWASKLARLYGDDLPITPLRSEIFVLDHTLVAGRLTPMVLDYSLGLAFHTEGRGLLISAGRTTPLPDAPATVSPDSEHFSEVMDRISRRVPEVASYGLAHSWAGLIEVTPDNNPIVGWTHLENVFTVAGFSGHGMSIAPGLAPEAARLLLGDRPQLPIDEYAYERFSAGRELDAEAIWSGARAYDAIEDAR